MVFSAPLFLSLFLPLLLAAYFLSKPRYRNFVLLGGSLLFYAWGEPRAVLLMIALIFINYAIGRGIGMARGVSPRKAKGLLAFGVAFDLASIGVFKYLSFFIANLNAIPGVNLIDPKIALPIGISFYTFQIISYLVDVYRRETDEQRNFFDFALYVSLFPQLIAGPIVRYTTICHEIRDRATRLDNVYYGLQRFIVGLAKKVMIADTMATAADTIFSSPAAEIPCGFAWAGILAYALQIFYDFSGYSDMAIGLGRVFNFRFLENFDHPYGSTSVREFWRRWHMSLSTWFRDYLYIPLGGSRASQARVCFNLFVVFFLCGLWHGASWCFAAWGLYHGLALAAERVLSKWTPTASLRIPKVVGNLYVWLFVLVGWVFFRSPTLDYALAYLKIMFTGNPAYPFVSYWPALSVYTHFMAFAAVIGVVFSYPWLSEKLASLKDGKTGAVLAFLLFCVVYVFAMTSNYSPFIYFRF